MSILYIRWDPPHTLFRLPGLDHEIRYYGLFFALGCLLAWFLIRSNLEKFFGSKDKATKVMDLLTALVLVGCIVGAKTFHMLFYDLDYLIRDPLSILRFWEPGLASHGGAIGVLIGLLLFWKLKKNDFLGASFFDFFDLFAPPIALAGVFIRIGNFFNQEILGYPTSLPWAVLFLHPADGIRPLPRHPVQLYEAVLYLVVYLVTSRIKGNSGLASGWFLVLLFSGRIFLEIFKSSQHGLFDSSFISTGQVLSFPFLIWGIWLILRSRKAKSI